jgi:hypothetical protein
LPSDENIWRLAFDDAESRLVVRDEWRSMRHCGVNDFTVDEFLVQRSAASESSVAFPFEKELAAS